MGAIVDLLNWIATPLFYAVSGILVAWHWLFSLVLPEDGGWTWVLSIIGLTVTIRAMLIPLFVKQIKSSRNMQLIQPKVRELQKKYGHDRQKLAEETMKLYKDAGTNPFASCMPLLLQMPIFLVLFRLLSHATDDEGRGFLSNDQASEMANAEWLGSTIADSFTSATHVSTQILCAFLVIVMIATTFTTQRQLMAKNMPPEAMKGQYATQQKLLLYVLPLVFAIGGIAFPIGLLLYWSTSNLWTMGQQFYVIRNNPAPGTPAAKAKEERDRAKRIRKGLPVDEPAAAAVTEVEERRPATRQQPQRKSRSQRKSGGESAGAVKSGSSAPPAGRGSGSTGSRRPTSGSSRSGSSKSSSSKSSSSKSSSSRSGTSKSGASKSGSSSSGSGRPSGATSKGSSTAKSSGSKAKSSGSKSSGTSPNRGSSSGTTSSGQASSQRRSTTGKSSTSGKGSSQKGKSGGKSGSKSGSPRSNQRKDGGAQ